jgi:ribulose-phosphate 3-epimerase
MAPIIAPSLLAADFSMLRQEVDMVNNSEADWFHLDIMDGVFVPNISFGFPVIEKIRKYAKKPFDVHLMIIDPDRYLERFRDAGAEIITIHLEACNHLHRSLQAIRSLGIKAGVAINPHTPVALLEDVICEVDLVCLMSVNPGFGGQKFIENTYRKISLLKEMISRYSAPVLIEIDGGVSDENSKRLVQAGADVLVAGNSVFGKTDPIKAIAELKKTQPVQV